MHLSDLIIFIVNVRSITVNFIARMNKKLVNLELYLLFYSFLHCKKENKKKKIPPYSF